ncbi:MAG: DUF89 family protein [Clostridia bacterium]|nr:DUF89 family protein [Clostridia bacterium]
MKINDCCEKCLLDKYMAKIPSSANETKKREYAKVLFEAVSESRMLSAPEVVEKIERVHARFFGPGQAYREIKRYFNQMMLSKEEMLYQKTSAASDPMKLAVQFAMAGNFIDFGAMKSVDEEKLNAFFDKADQTPLNAEVFSEFKDEIMKAKRLVFFTDNCGEIVADKVLMRVIKEMNPRIHITAVVRGFPALNDATLEDAEQVRLIECIDEILPNGTGVAGTVLSRLPKEADEAVKLADVCISKGQGNYESLCGCGLNLFYIFMCKCDLFADRFRVPLYGGVLTKE